MRDYQKTMKTPAIKILRLAFFASFAMTLLPSATHAQTSSAVPSVSANATTDKGNAAEQYASNGQKFSELDLLSTDELRKMPYAWQIEIKEWRLERLDQEAAEREIRIQNMDQENIQKSLDRWKIIQPMLASLPQDKVVAHLKTDIKGYKFLLRYLVDNKIQPLEYAEKLLQLLEKINKE